MTADEHAAEVEALRRRFPGWAVWYGPYTGHWWALPPRGSADRTFVEAPTPQHLIARIEGTASTAGSVDRPRAPDAQVQARPPADPRRDERRPSNLLRIEGVTPPQSPRVPVVAWPGSTER
ncbi:hypothetical protein [Actinomadura rayongensis]|uniref:Uncharacterized protein n=1 Tax=Actinomadura rayongensis TaxID=1429076 RepID=A0A6I4W245_9ACTN|nr:hypothetical protein [Actinomadura rayongensis]MXQ63553.1 hypothetical protein [Actinomadura rayongensis]